MSSEIVDGEKISFDSVAEAEQQYTQRIVKHEEARKNERHEKKVVKYYEVFLGKKAENPNSTEPEEKDGQKLL